jgi:hypothetical protein
MFVDLKGGQLDIQKPNPSPSFQYVRATLDLLRNDVSIDITPFHLNQKTEDTYWDSSNGTKAVGISRRN